MKSILFSLLICLILIVSGCTITVSDTNQTGAGIANPASTFCISRGYTHVIRTSPDGSQTGYCIFPNGGECEEWAFYRGTCSQSNETSQTTDQHIVQQSENNGLRELEDNYVAITCDALSPCPQGQSCYYFRDQNSPICWTGDPCSRCTSGRCTITEMIPASVSCTESTTVSDHEQVPVSNAVSDDDASVILNADLINGCVELTWEYDGRNLQFYKVVRSTTNTNPTYPEDGYIEAITDISNKEYSDCARDSTRTTYYRITAVLPSGRRIHSNVIMVEPGNFSQCRPIWSCTAWSSCENDVKVRRCTDLNNCGVITGKPAEAIRCNCTVTCSSNEECRDTNPCTIDTCINSGTCSSVCSNIIITDAIDNDSCCPAGLFRNQDNDCTSCGSGTILCNNTCITPFCHLDSQCDDHNSTTVDHCTNADSCSAVCTYEMI